MTRLATILVLTTAISGCQTFGPIEPLGEIEMGMTKAQVSTLAGSPTHRHYESAREAWEYCVNGWLVDDYALVWFDGDRVVGTEVLADYEFGRCRTTEGSFNWDDAPSG